MCLAGVARIRVELGWQYEDHGFDTARFGSWEELGAAERWESVWPCSEFDRVVTQCGHQARGQRAVEWLAHMQGERVLPVVVAGRRHRWSGGNAGPGMPSAGVAPAPGRNGPESGRFTVPLTAPAPPPSVGVPVGPVQFPTDASPAIDWAVRE